MIFYRNIYLPSRRAEIRLAFFNIRSEIGESFNEEGLNERSSNAVSFRYGCERCARASEMTNDAIDLTVTVRSALGAKFSSRKTLRLRF